MTGRLVRTVLGERHVETFDIVSPHEHVLSDSRIWLEDAADPSTHPLADPANLVLDDVEAQVAELQEFAHEGGLVVECTSLGMDPRPAALLDMARTLEPDVSIVTGAGWYVAASVPESVRRRDVDTLVDELLVELAGGTSGVPRGVIGEIGTSGRLDEAEERFLQAAGIAQAETGLGVQVHLDGSGREALRVIGVLEKAGADLSRVSLSHLDDVLDLEYCLAALETGCYIAVDAFGADWDIPGQHVASDQERIALVRDLCSRGHSDRILIAQDVWLRQRLVRGGGAGYGHLARSVVPALHQADLSVDLLTRRNPLRWLTGHDVEPRT